MSFLFRHLIHIHRELYASLLVGRGEKCTNHIAKQPARKPTKEEAGDELTELLVLRAGPGVLDVLRASVCFDNLPCLFPPCNHMDV
jgi:hypothetical protein